MADSFVYGQGISADGTVVVGSCEVYQVGPVPFRWTSEGGMVALEDPSGSLVVGSAVDASADGSVIVGYSYLPNNKVAFIWDDTNGMQSLKDLLVSYGNDLTGWTLSEAMGVSDDGMTIVGTGINPDGFDEGWIVRLPEPGTAVFVVFGTLATLRKRRLGS